MGWLMPVLTAASINLCYDRAAIFPALHSASLPAWHSFSFDTPFAAFDSVDIYTDASGGASKGDLTGPPAWAFLVFAWLNGTQHFIGYLGHPMPELEHSTRISAKAEFAAATWAALWLLQAPFPPGLPITFHSDNMDVVSTAQGGTVAEPLRQSRALLDGVCKILRLTRNFSWVHVHGHQADPLNEMVDTVARLYSLGLLPPLSPSAPGALTGP